MVSVNIIDIIKGYIKCILNINSTKLNKSSLSGIYGTQHVLTSTVSTTGDNYSSVTTSDSVICGNLLRVYFSATRSSNTGTGNVSNELIATIKIDNSSGLIGNYYYMTAVSGSTGPVTTFYGKISKYENNYVYVSVYLTTIHSAAKSFNGYLWLPILLNVSV